jgi:NADH:ubiquinone oxidoreductase subunit
MNKNWMRICFAFFGLSLLAALPLPAQNAAGAGYDYNGRAITAILPFTGDEEAAAIFNKAVAAAAGALEKYSPRLVTSGAVISAGVRIPTDMPPLRELVPGARYALTGGVYPGSNEDDYYLQLWLWDMSGATMIYTDDLVYQNINEALNIVPGLVEWLFSHIVDVIVKSEPAAEKGWDDNRLTLGLRAGVSQRWYTAPSESVAGAQALNFEGTLLAAVLLNPLFSLQGEIVFTYDDLVYRGVTDIGGGAPYTPVLANEKYTSYSLMFPVLLKANFTPGDIRLAPFAGLYTFCPLGKTSYRKNPTGETGSYSWSSDVPLGFTVGLEAAVRAGSGMILFDFRYSSDFDTINIHNDPGTAYKRGMLSLSAGYALGFISLKK